MPPKKAEMPAATLDMILAADDTHKAGEPFEVPEWGLTVRLRGLTRGETKLFQTEDMDVPEIEANMLSLALVDPKVTLEQARDLLEQKGFTATERILQRILNMSGQSPGFRPPEAD